MRKLICASFIVMTSCAHQKTESVRATPLAKTAKVAHAPVGKPVKVGVKLSAKAPQSEEAREFARDRKLVLQKKTKSAPSFVRANPQNKRLELNLKPILKPVAEDQLITELRDRFDQNDEIGFQSRYQALQVQHPRAAVLNEAHYMAGLLALTNKNYGRALKAFDLVLKNPRSAQAPQAMFAKAITYKRMNLREPSNGLLRQVQASYPKSIEAQRAALEMKIEQQRTR